MCVRVYIYIYISCAVNMDFSDTLAIRTYQFPLLADLLNYIQCPYRDVVDMF